MNRIDKVKKLKEKLKNPTKINIINKSSKSINDEFVEEYIMFRTCNDANVVLKDLNLKITNIDVNYKENTHHLTIEDC